MIQADKILKSLRLTEKSNLQSAELGQYTFEVFKMSLAWISHTLRKRFRRFRQICSIL